MATTTSAINVSSSIYNPQIRYFSQAGPVNYGTAQNDSIWDSNFNNSYNANDYSGLSLDQLQQKRAQIIYQSQQMAETYPELQAQYQVLLNNIDTEINKKLSNGVSASEKNATIANMDSKINEYEMALQMINTKRANLVTQSQEAAGTYPELQVQYHIQDKQLEAEKVKIESLTKSLREQKAKILNSNSSPINQNNNQFKYIFQMIMTLLQSLFRGGMF